MRIHVTVCGYVLFFAFRLGLDRTEMACLFLTIGAVMAAEAMNTAVEKLCDFTEKRRNPHIHKIKDAAAGAVLLTAVAAVLVGAAVLFRPELWQLVLEIGSSPLPLTAFLLSAALSLAFIFVGPVRLWEMLTKRK